MALGDRYRTDKRETSSGLNKYGIKPGETFASYSSKKKKERASIGGGTINFYNTTPSVASRGYAKRRDEDEYIPVLGKALRTKKELEEIEMKENKGGSKMGKGLVGLLDVSKGRRNNTADRYGKGRSKEVSGGLQAILADKGRRDDRDRRLSLDRRDDLVVDNGLFAFTADGKYVEKQDENTRASVNVLSLVNDIPSNITDSGVEVSWGYMVLLELGNNKEFLNFVTDDVRDDLRKLGKAVNDRDTDRIKQIFTSFAEALGPYRSCIPNTAVVTFAVIGKYAKNIGTPVVKDGAELPPEVVAAIANFRMYVTDSCLKNNNSSLSSRLPDYLIEDLHDLLDTFSTGSVDDILRSIEYTKKSANGYAQQNKNIFNNASMLYQNLKLLQDTINQYTKRGRRGGKFGINTAGGSDRFGIADKYGLASDRFGKSRRDEGLGLAGSLRRDRDDDDDYDYNNGGSLSILSRKRGSVVDRESDFERSRREAERVNPYIAGRETVRERGSVGAYRTVTRDRDREEVSGTRDAEAMNRSLKEATGMI